MARASRATTRPPRRSHAAVPVVAGSAAAKKLERVTAICLALPDTELSTSGDHATYRVRGKVFAYFLNDHHGDGILSVCVKSELGENLDRVRREPDRFYSPAYIGPRGWFGLRLDRGRVDWDEVASVVERSFRLTAPATVLRKLAAGIA